MSVFALFLVLFLSAVALPSYGAPCFVMDQPLTGVNVSSWVGYRELPASMASEDIQDHLDQWVKEPGLFHYPGGRSFSFGFSNQRILYRFDIESRLSNDEEITLEIPTSWLKHVMFYVRSEQGWLQLNRSIMSPRAEWDPSHQYPLARISVPSMSRQTVFILIHTPNTHYASFSLKSLAGLQSDVRLYSVFYGSLFGILRILAIINLFIYISTREKSFLWYVGYVLSFGVVIGLMEGVILERLPIQWWQSYDLLRLHTIFLFLVICFGSLFTRSFLNLSVHAPTFEKMIKVVSWMSLAMAGISVLSSHHGITLIVMNTMVTSTPALAIAAAIKVARRGSRYGRYYLVAWVPLFLAIGVFFLSNYSYIPPSFFSQNVVYIGATVEGILLSLGLSVYLKQIIINHLQLKKGIEQATEVQMSLIRPFPDLDYLRLETYYQAIDTSGGDWYACIKDRNRGVFLFIGDVTGHSISSAMLTSAVAGCIEATVDGLDEQADPEQKLHAIAQQANRVAHLSASRTTQFMTMMMIYIDPKAQTISCLNAGHCAALITDSKGTHPLFKPGSPLGLTNYPIFHSLTLSLEQESCLFLYTDGLIENIHKDGGVLGLRHIEKLLSCEASAAETRQKILELYRPDAVDPAQGDDCTFVVARLSLPRDTASDRGSVPARQKI